MTAAKEGMKVKIHYTGTLEDGEVFDSSEGREPLEFTIGEGMIIKGFEEAVIGMEPGQEKDIVIPPEKGYGEPRPELIQKMPKDKLGDLQPEVGMIIGMQIPGIDQTFPAKIAVVEEETITVDLNPPLAGKTLHFHIKMEAAEDAGAQPTEQEDAVDTEEEPEEEQA